MKIAVLSANPKLYSTSRLVDAAIERGHEVEVINHNHCYVAMETGNNNVYLGEQALTDFQAIIPRIGASVTFYGSSIIRQFEVKQVYTTLSSLALVRSRDKLRATQVLAKHGIGIPKTVFAKQPRDVQNLIKTVGGPPLIVKLLEGTQGLGVVLAETKTAAKSVIEAFYGLNANILVQEFIKEAGGSDIRVVVVGGKVIAAYKRQGQEGEFRSNLHRGGQGEKVKLSAAEKKTAVAATKALGLNIAGVDMLRSERGPLVLEVNSSPGFEGVEKVTGTDVAGKIIEFIEKQVEKPLTRTKDKVGV
jgi:ribosomal protein S6--L-glutamate ligase